jgi:hypothetical protein
MKPTPQKKWGKKTYDAIGEPRGILKHHNLKASQKPPQGSNQKTLVDAKSPKGEKMCSKYIEK